RPRGRGGRRRARRRRRAAAPRRRLAARRVSTADERLERYAELAVRVGANVQPGQLVDVVARVEHAPLVRALARASYRAGARYVDALYIDQHVRRAMIELGPDETLEYTDRKSTRLNSSHE